MIDVGAALTAAMQEQRGIDLVRYPPAPNPCPPLFMYGRWWPCDSAQMPRHHDYLGLASHDNHDLRGCWSDEAAAESVELAVRWLAERR